MQRTRDICIKYIDKWTLELANKNIAFVESRHALIDRLMNYKERPSFFSAILKRTDINYTYKTPVVIYRVLTGNTKIWSPDEKQNKYDSIHILTRGEDVNNNKETERFYKLLDLVPELLKIFTFNSTVRGTLADFIGKFNNNSSKAIGLQIASAYSTDRNQFHYNKKAKDLVTYLKHNLIIILIGIVDDKIAGVYFIPPLSDVIINFSKFGNINIGPSMLAKREVSSNINKYLENYRYLNNEFTKDVKGTYKSMSQFVIDFFDIINTNFLTLTNTEDYFTSLFKGEYNRIEWLGNKSFNIHVSPLLNITQTINHGERGDIFIHFIDKKYTLLDERKTLKFHRGITSCTHIFRIRSQGSHGLNPNKVHITTAFIRNRLNTEEIIGFIILPVIDSNGQLALRPDRPDALDFSLRCNINNREEWISVNSKFISPDIYPSYLTRLNDDTIEIKAVFYYDRLYNKNSNRLNDLSFLYNTISTRIPSLTAINAYNNSITDELINNEKQFKHSKIE